MHLSPDLWEVFDLRTACRCLHTPSCHSRLILCYCCTGVHSFQVFTTLPQNCSSPFPTAVTTAVTPLSRRPIQSPQLIMAKCSRHINTIVTIFNIMVLNTLLGCLCVCVCKLLLLLWKHAILNGNISFVLLFKTVYALGRFCRLKFGYTLMANNNYDSYNALIL